MARSLTITQEESASTTPLLTWFLALAAMVLLVGTFVVAADGAPPSEPAPAPTTQPLTR